MNPNKVLFLDIDGVMRRIDDPTPGFHLDSKAVHHLNWILQKTNCTIVISSTWRQRLALTQIQEIFREEGFECVESIFDVTPDFGNVPRGAEIVAWLKDHPTTSAYAALDDGDDLDDCAGHVVQTRAHVGLTRQAAENVIELLQNTTS